jgi:hypothetical protein
MAAVAVGLGDVGGLGLLHGKPKHWDGPGLGLLLPWWWVVVPGWLLQKAALCGHVHGGVWP